MMHMIHRYIKRLHKIFLEYNAAPVPATIAKSLNGKSDILYYWLYCNKWKDKTVRKVRVITQIHDMWSLHLFVDIKYIHNRATLVYKNYEEGYTDIPLLTEFTDISIKPRKMIEGEWYKGDIIKCTYKGRSISDRVWGKKLVLFPFPKPGDGIYPLEFRRISQLVPFNKLTEPCQKQDEPFYDNNIQRYKGIYDSL